MKIMLIADPFIRVPPRYYGGIERIVYDISKVYVKQGHEVTLIAAPGSESPGRLIGFGRQGEWNKWSNFRNFMILSRILRREIRRHDIVHNFGRLVYLLSITGDKIPKVQTYMRGVRALNIRLIRNFNPKNLFFTAVSNFIKSSGVKGGGTWRTIYNCASLDDYRFNGDVDPNTAPLIFLSRLERCKGVHSAIKIAHKCNRKLIIAGNISGIPKEINYFHEEIKPFIDNRLITYAGPVNNEQKNKLLGSSAAMLFPIEWEEPFGIVMIESLACGTPVIGFKRGAVPEIIKDGINGFVCDTQEEIIEAVKKIKEIDRKKCRRIAETKFSSDVIAEEYLTLYKELIDKV